ncbi:MAG: hypothetical protein ACERKJ_01090 [Candidatus Dadabacteria bacterium]|jgi:hypothetical protein
MSTDTNNQQTCRCGYTRDHAWIVPKPSYSFWGWILVGTGISHPPTEVKFECDKCGEVFERITDPVLLKTHSFK